MIYIASPLFSDQERCFNAILAAELEQKHKVFLPQRDGLLLSKLIESGVAHQAASERVFNLDIRAIRECNLVVCVLDGRAVDEGVAFELGFAYALGKKSIAFQSDSRRLLPEGNNPMLHCAICAYFKDIQQLCAAAGTLLKSSPFSAGSTTA